jgi:hypothetical protein
MKTFKGYLKEEVAWQQSTSKMIFDFGNKFSIKIPVSSAILDKIFPDKIRTTVFHVTDIKGGENLIKLQKKKKTISSFFFMDTSYLIQGVKGGGGVIAELDGNVVVSAKSDIMSMPDKTGRRWIELGTLSQYGAIEDDAVDVIYKLGDKYNWHKDVEDSAILSKAGELFKKLDLDLAPIANFGKYWELKGLLDNKSKSLLIKDYIDGMTKVLKKNKKTVGAALRDYSNKRVTKRSWDEQLVDQFTIQKIHLLPHQVIGVEDFKDVLKKKRIPYKDWDVDYAGLATYISQVAKSEMRTMGTK